MPKPTIAGYQAIIICDEDFVDTAIHPTRLARANAVLTHITDEVEIATTRVQSIAHGDTAVELARLDDPNDERVDAILSDFLTDINDELVQASITIWLGEPELRP